MRKLMEGIPLTENSRHYRRAHGANILEDGAWHIDVPIPLRPFPAPVLAM